MKKIIDEIYNEAQTQKYVQYSKLELGEEKYSELKRDLERFGVQVLETINGINWEDNWQYKGVLYTIIDNTIIAKKDKHFRCK